MKNIDRLGLASFCVAACLWISITGPARAEEASGVFHSPLADGSGFTIVDAKRSERTFALGIHAVVVIDDREAKLADLRAGDAVMVMWENQQGKAVATLVVCKRH